MDEAEKFKCTGNLLLGKKDYQGAIEEYTKAIEICNKLKLNVDNKKLAIYYSNRAAAYLKTESFGLAIADANKSIENDSAYIKAYYRRAIANISISKYNNALLDFKMVVKKHPNDLNAKNQLKECQKLINKISFEKAIEVGNEPLFIDKLEDELKSMNLNFDNNDDKELLKLWPIDEKINENFIEYMIELFKKLKKIPKFFVYRIILDCVKILRSQPTIVDINLNNKNEKLTICGDIHGQFFDLLNIFKLAGKPSNLNKFLFNGDFVDRGSWSLEVVLTLYSYKILYPNSFFLNRGNHETDEMNKVYGFAGECKHKYITDKVFKAFSESFSSLPLGCLVDNKHLVLHGGLFSNDDVTLNELRSIDRLASHLRQPGQKGLMMEMLWTDPQTANGRSTSKRGIGIQFGPDITESFCKANNLKTIIRSHEVRMEGYEVEHNGKLITIFSAPNYCDFQGNKGAFITVTGEDTDNLDFTKFEAVQHPDIKPMAYANNLMK